MDSTPTFRVEAIDNGFIVYFSPGYGGRLNARQYVANEAEVGEFVTAKMVQLMLEAKDK